MTEAAETPVDSIAPSVEVKGYRVLLPIAVALVLVPVVIWTLLGEASDVDNRDRRIAAGVAAVAMVPIFAAVTFRLRLTLDTTAQTLTVVRRGLLGRGRTWTIALTDLESWYYAESIQCLVLRRRERRPLRFVIWMGAQPALLNDWAQRALAPYADPVGGQAASRRALRILMWSFSGGTMAIIIAMIVAAIVLL